MLVWCEHTALRMEGALQKDQKVCLYTEDPRGLAGEPALRFLPAVKWANCATVDELRTHT